jgi:Domain of unknown function (DUF5916)/Carbohydrate family 9 binding domain-like
MKCRLFAVSAVLGSLTIGAPVSAVAEVAEAGEKSELAPSGSSAGGSVHRPSDTPATDAAAPSIPTSRAVRRTGGVAVDGVLGEEAWRAAPRHRGFTQRFPKDGAKPNVETEFAVLFDNDALYIGIWAKDASPHLIKGLLTRRDEESASDSVMVAIDSYHDRRTAFAFGLNPAGVQRDMIIYDDTSTDSSWDAVWSGAASVAADGWVAEYRIPLSQLRFSGDVRQQWGLQVQRVVARTGEEMSWSPWPRSQPQIVSRFGIVDGIERLRSSRHLEVLPYVTAGVASRPVDAGDPLNDEITPEGNVGVDVKYGLSSSFSLAATINPDFGQVEADPSQVNLSANELFFPEKRPFFLDGVDLFTMGVGQGDNSSETLFYSRRIGAAPHGSPDGDFVSSPSSTAIYGATKISGKTRGGWSVGFLDAVTAREDADFIDSDGRRGSAVVEPLTNYAVAKVKRDFREGRTTVSAAATSVNRRLTDTGLADELHDQAYTGGLELQHRFAKDRVSLSAKLLGSYVHGSADAIAETQQSSRHRFQRPDASHLSFDPTRTSLAGAGLVADVGYRDGHWQLATGANVRTPGLELNDLGFQFAADQYEPWVFGSYRDDDPGPMLLNYQVGVNVYALSSLEPQVAYTAANAFIDSLLANHWAVGAGAIVNRRRWSFDALRGGPALRDDLATGGWAYVDTDTRKAVSGGIFTSFRTQPDTISYSADVGVGITAQAASNLKLSLRPSFAVNEENAQYIDQVEDDSGVTRYLVGRIRQTSASLTVRVAWTLSPRLSLQAYAQPFLATGGYEDYKEVVNAGAGRVRDRFAVLAPGVTSTMDDIISVDRDGNGAAEYSFERPDFGFRELNSTLVMRWEYRPGSSLFAIWSHGQSSSDSDGDFRLGDGISALGNGEAEDIVMVKANYWMAL